jgi:hypothetical protein
VSSIPITRPIPTAGRTFPKNKPMRGKFTLACRLPRT